MPHTPVFAVGLGHALVKGQCVALAQKVRQGGLLGQLDAGELRQGGAVPSLGEILILDAVGSPVKEHLRGYLNLGGIRVKPQLNRIDHAPGHALCWLQRQVRHPPVLLSVQAQRHGEGIIQELIGIRRLKRDRLLRVQRVQIIPDALEIGKLIDISCQAFAGADRGAQKLCIRARKAQQQPNPEAQAQDQQQRRAADGQLFDRRGPFFKLRGLLGLGRLGIGLCFRTERACLAGRLLRRSRLGGKVFRRRRRLRCSGFGCRNGGGSGFVGLRARRGIIRRDRRAAIGAEFVLV